MEERYMADEALPVWQCVSTGWHKPYRRAGGEHGCCQERQSHNGLVPCHPRVTGLRREPQCATVAIPDACYSPIDSVPFCLSRLQYYRRIFQAYLGPRQSQLSFGHDTPEINPRATFGALGEYYMPFPQKADYA